MLQVEFLKTWDEIETSLVLLPVIIYEKMKCRNMVQKQIVIGFIIWAVIIKWEKVIKE